MVCGEIIRSICKSGSFSNGSSTCINEAISDGFKLFTEAMEVLVTLGFLSTYSKGLLGTLSG